MSAEFTLLPARWALVRDPRQRHVLRYAVGSALGMAIAMGVAWDLSYLVPVISLIFLAAPGPPPPLSKALTLVGIVAGACFFGLWSIKYLLGYPFVFFLLLLLIVMHIYYLASGGASPFLILWLFVAVLVLPLVAVQSPGIAVYITRGITLGAAVSMIVIFAAHMLVPDLPQGAEARGAAVAKAKPVQARPSRAERARMAIVQTAVLSPLILLVHVFEWLDGILFLIMAALLSQNPAIAKSFKAGSGLILGNLLGGLAAILMYNLLTVVREYPYMVLLTLLAGLFFGSRLLSDRKTAALYGSAYSTMLLVIGSVTTSTDDASSAVYSRVFQITMAVTYLVVAFGTVERYQRARGH